MSHHGATPVRGWVSNHNNVSSGNVIYWECRCGLWILDRDPGWAHENVSSEMPFSRWWSGTKILAVGRVSILNLNCIVFNCLTPWLVSLLFRGISWYLNHLFCRYCEFTVSDGDEWDSECFDFYSCLFGCDKFGGDREKFIRSDSGSRRNMM